MSRFWLVTFLGAALIFGPGPGLAQRAGGRPVNFCGTIVASGPSGCTLLTSEGGAAASDELTGDVQWPAGYTGPRQLQMGSVYDGSGVVVGASACTGDMAAKLTRVVIRRMGSCEARF